jgi:hypothetical protein
MRGGLLAEFGTPDAALSAVHALREQGYRRIDLFTPFPLEGAEEALELRRSSIPIIVLVAGIVGCATAYVIQWWCNAVDYRLNVGGFPAHSGPAYIPVTFETTVLFACLAAFFGLFYFCGLPRLWDPLFEVPGFERASIDRFFLALDSDDELFDRERSVEHLGAFGPLRVEPFGSGAAT